MQALKDEKEGHSKWRGCDFQPIPFSGKVQKITYSASFLLRRKMICVRLLICGKRHRKREPETEETGYLLGG